MSVLPDPGVRLDTVGMWDLTVGLPEQVAAAARSVEGLGLPASDDIDHVVVFGMGGSGIGGDVLAAIAAPIASVPVTVVKGYECPAYVGARSLCIAVSFSGNTEEVVEAASEAVAVGAQVVAVSSGGALADLAAGWSARWIRLPSDIPMPRAGIGAVAVPLLLVLEDLGVMTGARDQVAAAVAQLRRRRDALVRPGNVAEELARRLRGTVPIVYGGGALGAVAASRWKNQVNENAKAPAFAGTLPGALPQRDLRLGPERRPHPAGVQPRPAPPRLRAPPGRPPRSASSPSWSTRWWPPSRRSGPRAKAPWRSCSTSCSSATSCPCTWPTTSASTPAPSPCSRTSRPACASPPADADDDAG